MKLYLFIFMLWGLLPQIYAQQESKAFIFWINKGDSAMEINQFGLAINYYIKAFPSANESMNNDSTLKNNEVLFALNAKMSICRYMLEDYSESIEYSSRAINMGKLKSLGWIDESYLRIYRDELLATIYYFRGLAYLALKMPDSACKSWELGDQYDQLRSNKRNSLEELNKYCK